MRLKKEIKEMNKEELLDMMKDNIQKLFRANKLSGIIEIPGKGTFSIFKDEGSRLKILHHARIELNKLDIEIDQLAKRWVIEENGGYNEEKKDKKAYIG